ncbi:MAG: hypothetical protein BAJALOKI1v1_230034 [Promethearchaeota archaeon]|nr:MAG: hypothetical protein BAJALOKI1v1_230034 [Candidatus Lokiarchaeota archaeon]
MVKLLEYLYKNPFNFHNNKALVKIAEKNWVFINKSGNIIKKLEKPIDHVESFDGVYGIIVINSKYGFITAHGEIVVQPIYSQIKNSQKHAG